MTSPKKGDLSSQHKKAAAKTNYYWIISVEQETSQDEYTPKECKAKSWVVNFGVSTDKGDLDGDDEKNYLGSRALKKLLTAPYKEAGLKPPMFELDISHNWNTARAETKEQAEQIASEIVYIFKNAGIEPMDEDEGKYPAKIPGTNTIVAFTPPRKAQP